MSEEVLSRHWEELKKHPGVLSVFLSTKWKGGKDTGVRSITFYVQKKLPESQLPTEHIIPKTIEGVPTDVLELNPAGWIAGKTAISELPPDLQIKRMGLIPKPPASPKPRVARSIKTPSGYSDFIKWMSPIQDQGNCGCCTDEGTIGVWEADIRIAENNPADPIKLSEAALFFCVAGATCETGSTIDAVLDQAVSGGACTETVLPYTDVDQLCTTLPKTYKLASWATLDNETDIENALDAMPLVATMAVHQSILLYQSGVYQNQGASDPVIGYHCVGAIGYSVAMATATITVPKLIRSSWGTGWGPGCVVNGVVCPGNAWVAGSELDPEMYQLTVAITPAPAPTPTPPTPNPVQTFYPVWKEPFVDSPPGIPNGLGGTLYLDGQPVSDGTYLEADIINPTTGILQCRGSGVTKAYAAGNYVLVVPIEGMSGPDIGLNVQLRTYDKNKNQVLCNESYTLGAFGKGLKMIDGIMTIDSTFDLHAVTPAPPIPPPAPSIWTILTMLWAWFLSLFGIGGNMTQLTVSKATWIGVLTILAGLFAYVITNNMVPGYSLWIGLAVVAVQDVINMLQNTTIVKLQAKILELQAELNKVKGQLPRP